MKRSWCVSALIVGLSLASASVAFASGDEGASSDDGEGKRVAQNETTAPAGSDPRPAPSEAEPTPNVTLGTQKAIGTDTPAAAKSEAEPASETRRWSGSAIYATTSMTTATVFQGQQLYSDPTIESAMWLAPRYAFSEAWQLRGRLIVSYELTNSDTTVYRNEPLLSDTSLQLAYRSIPQILTLTPLVAAGITAPTSKISQARTMVVTPSLLVQVDRPIPKVLGGDVLIRAGVTYSHPFYSSENAEVRDERPAGSFQCAGGNGCQDLLTGTLNPSDSLQYTVLVAGQWGRFSPALAYVGASQWVYHPTDVTNPVDGKPVSDPTGFERSSVRQTSYFSAAVGYDVSSWLNAEVGYWLSRNSLDASGQYGNPVFDRYQDARVYLGATLLIDNLVKRLQGEGPNDPRKERMSASSSRHVPMRMF